MIRSEAEVEITDAERAEWDRQIRLDRDADLRGGRMFLEACQTADVAAFWDAVSYISDCTIGGWEDALRRVARLQSVVPEIRAAFATAWIENKSIAQHFGSHMPVIRGLRVLLPDFEGTDPVVLYRGASAKERRERKYGISWTTDLATADKFATDARQTCEGGSLILETVAPPAAIISALDTSNDHYGEKEYFIDRRQLRAVRVNRRLPQISSEAFLQQNRASC